MIDDGSPKHKRRSLELEERKEASATAGGATSRRALGSRKDSISDDSSKIVVDTESILDMLMGAGGEEEEEDLSEDEGLRMRIKGSPPVKGKPPKPQGGRALENGPLSRRFSGGRFEDDGGKSKIGSSTSDNSLQKMKSRDTKSAKTDYSNRNVMELPALRGQRTVPEPKAEDKEEERPIGMRGRSSAIDTKSSASMRTKAFLAKTRSDSINEDEPEEAKKKSVTREEKEKTERRAARVERSSSIRSDDRAGSLRRSRMSGEQALGIFYHS